MSEFDKGFGSAIADKIVDDDIYENEGFLMQVYDDQVSNLKVAIRTLSLNLTNAVSARNEKVAQINSMPDGPAKDQAVSAFKDIDEGGWFSPSFETQVNAVGSVLEQIGLTAQLPTLQTLGIFGVDDAAIAAIPTAMWVSAVALTATILALGTYFGTQVLRYTALVINPDINDPTATTAFAQSLGGGAKIGIIIAALGGVAYYLMMAKTKSVISNPRRKRR